MRNNAVVPGVTSLIRWQSHWHVVRQSWPFFQNDFAGRIANRVMQTSNALRESVVSSIRAIWYIVIYGVSALVLMAFADPRLAIPTVLWFAGYIFFLRHFVPRMRDLARTSSELRSLVMGRVVDSYTNILTVKLFARARDEDAYVREVIDDHTRRDRRPHAADHALHVRAVDDERAAAGRDGRHRNHALGAGLRQRRRGRDRASAGMADRQRRRLGELGSDRHLREHRRRAGRHGYDRRAAYAGRPARCAGARGAARRDPLRAI